jgi:hypothetical protein
MHLIDSLIVGPFVDDDHSSWIKAHFQSGTIGLVLKPHTVIVSLLLRIKESVVNSIVQSTVMVVVNVKRLCLVSAFYYLLRWPLTLEGNLLHDFLINKPLVLLHSFKHFLFRAGFVLLCPSLFLPLLLRKLLWLHSVKFLLGRSVELFWLGDASS